MFVAFAYAYLAAAAAGPSDPAPIAPTPPVAPVAKPVAEKKICVSETSLGSIMPKRVCRTQAEWDAVNKEMGRRSVELPSRGPIRN